MRESGAVNSRLLLAFLLPGLAVVHAATCQVVLGGAWRSTTVQVPIEQAQEMVFHGTRLVR
ncbi:MAG: hypothetical protein ACFFD4_12505 [Candidatus Odinarchaeota archaeon]